MSLWLVMSPLHFSEVVASFFLNANVHSTLRNLTFLPLQDDFNATGIRPNNLDPLLSIGKRSNLAIGNSRRIALNVSWSLHDEWCKNTTPELA